MNTNTTISNEAVFDLLLRLQDELREFKSDIHKKLEYIEKRLDRMEDQRAEDRKILMDLWQSREKVKIGFSRGFIAVNGIFAAMISFLTALFTQTYQQ